MAAKKLNKNDTKVTINLEQISKSCPLKKPSLEIVKNPSELLNQQQNVSNFLK